jgi:hypothetical protein
MAAPNMPRVVEFLLTMPRGAYGWQIAAHLEASVDSARQTLAKMYARGKIVQQLAGDTCGNSVWSLPADAYVETPPVFRAKETLAGFQEAARARQASATQTMKSRADEILMGEI